MKKMPYPAADLETEITAYLVEKSTHPGGVRTTPGCNLQHGIASVLCTCHETIPRATPVDFFCTGDFSLWITGEPGGKIANIMRNPRVAVGIYEPVDHAREQRSLQIQGRARLVNQVKQPEQFCRLVEQFGLRTAVDGSVEEFVPADQLPGGDRGPVVDTVLRRINFIHVQFERVVLLHMQPGKLPVKRIWENGSAVQLAGAL